MADHFAQLTLGTYTPSGTTAFGLGVCVRFAAAAQTYYLGIVEGGVNPDFRIMKFVAGTPTTLASATQTSLGVTVASGGILQLRVSGASAATLTLFYNGAPLTGFTVTDSSSPILANTNVGFHAYRATTGVHATMSEFRYGT